MSRRKKGAYLAVTMAAGLAMAVDRCILSNGSTEPQLAVARQASASTKATAQPSVLDAPTLSIPEMPFPRGIKASFDPRSPIRDLFAPPEAIRNDDANGAGADKDNPDATRSERANRAIFMSQHRLDGVVIQQRLRIAIVDGVWMQVGQSLDGCTLTAISGSEVRFSCADGRAVLKVNAADALLQR